MDRGRGQPRAHDRLSRAVSQLSRFPQRVLTAVALACAALVALVFGIIDGTQRWDSPEHVLLSNLRLGVSVLAGVFLFGAGLLYLAAGRIESAPGRLRMGGALTVLGVGMPLAVVLGPLVHTAQPARILSPVLATVTAVVTLALLTLTPSDPDGFWRRPGALLALCGVVTLVVALAFTSYVNQWRFDPPRWVHVSLELMVAGAWLAAAVVLSRGRRPGTPLTTGDLDGLILAALGGVWFLRVGATYDVVGWGISPTLLLLAVAVVAATHAMTHLLGSVEVERQRLDEAEYAAQQALDQLASVREERALLRHGARNSLYALRLAAQTLAEHGEVLDSQSRQRLQWAIRDESAALSTYMEDDRRPREEERG